MHICPWGASGHMGEIYAKLFLFIPLFEELTYRSDPSMEFHTWWLKRRGLAHGCAFLVFISHVSSLKGSAPKKKKQFWGVNRRFQAKLAKSKNLHIIKTTASIPTKFCTVIKTTKCPSWVVHHTHHKFKMADGRHLGKIEKSPYLGRVRSSIFLTVPTVKNFKL